MTRQFLIGYLGQFGFLAWVLLIGGIALAFWKFKRWHTRTLAVVLILGLFAAYPGHWAWDVQKRVERYDTGRTMFLERCATKAGYRINKVIEDVDGILLPKVRQKVDWSDRMAPGAAFAGDRKKDEYIGVFLAYRHLSDGDRYTYSVTKPTDGRKFVPGFRYVDVIDEKDGQRYRHAARWEDSWEDTWENSKVYVNGGIRVFFGRVPSSEPSPRYAVTFEDHVIPEERQYGIASSTVKVTDTQTNEVLGEMTRYIYYPGTFEKGNPNPWLRADQCPGFNTTDDATRLFVDRVLVARGATLPSPLTWHQLPN